MTPVFEIEWDAVNSADYYIIYRCADKDFPENKSRRKILFDLSKISEFCFFHNSVLNLQLRIPYLIKRTWDQVVVVEGSQESWWSSVMTTDWRSNYGTVTTLGQGWPANCENFFPSLPGFELDSSRVQQSLSHFASVAPPSTDKAWKYCAVGLTLPCIVGGRRNRKNCAR